VSSQIRAAREHAGLSQAQLAKLAGIAASNLSAIESGQRRASTQMMERLYAAMRRPSQALAAHREAVAAAVRQYGAENPRVFGSVARGEDAPGSDLDLLVHVPPQNAWRFVALKGALEGILGVPVDVISEGGLTAKHRGILGEAVPL